jgi:hypothetical protein
MLRGSLKLFDKIEWCILDGWQHLTGLASERKNDITFPVGERPGRRSDGHRKGCLACVLWVLHRRITGCRSDDRGASCHNGGPFRLSQIPVVTGAPPGSYSAMSVSPLGFRGHVGLESHILEG